jgi:hypothetical protein
MNEKLSPFSHSPNYRALIRLIVLHESEFCGPSDNRLADAMVCFTVNLRVMRLNEASAGFLQWTNQTRQPHYKLLS